LNIENGSSRCFTVSPFTGELNLLFEQWFRLPVHSGQFWWITKITCIDW
jgi:hypothetical protein